MDRLNDALDRYAKMRLQNAVQAGRSPSNPVKAGTIKPDGVVADMARLRQQLANPNANPQNPRRKIL